MARETLICVPDIGDFEDVEVVEILVGPGDVVAVEDPLISIESDKATMEIPSPVAGRVHEVRVGLGDPVSEGSVLLVLIAEEAATPEEGEARAEEPAAREEIPPPSVVAPGTPISWPAKSSFP